MAPISPQRCDASPPRGPRTGSTLARLALCILAVGLPVAAQALETLPGAGDPRVVADAVLAEQRGGFFGRDGLQIAIGLEQITALNGEILHQSTLHPLGTLGAATSHPSAGRITILNATAGLPAQTFVSETASGQGWVTTIQNQLDGQAIQHQTILQLELRNLQMPRSDLGRALEQQLTDGGRGW